MSKKQELKKRVFDKQNFDALLDSTFKKADLDKSDYIEIKELAIVLKSIYATLGQPLPSQSDIDQEMKRLDKNGDKKLSKQEFRVLVKDLCLFFIENSD